MAGKNVTIAGASYTAVPAVDIPVTGGGTARFTEVSDTTAVASDVAQGKTFYDASGVLTTGTAGGGPQYTASITTTGNSSYAYARYPGSSGTKYYTAGNTFDIEEGENIYVYGSGSRGGTYIYLNGTQVAATVSGARSYTYTVPTKTSVEIELRYSSDTYIYITEIQSAAISITENGTYDVSEYDVADVNVSGGGTDFVVTISYNSNTQQWEPDQTFAEIQTAYNAGKTLVMTTGELYVNAECEYNGDYDYLMYQVSFDHVDGWIWQMYEYNSNGLTLDDEGLTEYPNYETVSKTYTPTTSTQTETVTYDSSNYNGLQQVNVTVNAMPSGSVTAPSTISGTSASVSTGTNTLTLSKTVSVTPSVTTSGYVSSGTAGNSAVSLTASVTTKGSATITPTTTNQTIASGTYLTGTQTIAGDANLVAGNIKKDIQIFNVTGTYEASGGGATVKTGETASLSSTVTSVSISGLTGKPLIWALQNEVANGSYFSGASTRYITSCLCDGGSTVYSLCMYKSGSTAREYGYNTCTWSYSNGTITITSPGTGTAGGFRTGSKYRLFYAY